MNLKHSLSILIENKIGNYYQSNVGTYVQYAWMKHFGQVQLVLGAHFDTCLGAIFWMHILSTQIEFGNGMYFGMYANTII